MNLNINSAIGITTIYNYIGELIYKQETKEHTTQINLIEQPSGIYLVRVRNQNIKEQLTSLTTRGKIIYPFRQSFLIPDNSFAASFFSEGASSKISISPP